MSQTKFKRSIVICLNIVACMLWRSRPALLINTSIRIRKEPQKTSKIWEKMRTHFRWLLPPWKSVKSSIKTVENVTPWVYHAWCRSDVHVIWFRVIWERAVCRLVMVRESVARNTNTTATNTFHSDERVSVQYVTLQSRWS